MQQPPIPGIPPGQRVRSISVEITHLRNGGYRVAMTGARGWAAVATNPVQLARAVEQGFLESQVAAYARAKGEAYDLDALTTHVPGDALADSPQGRARDRRAPRRAKVFAPEEWTRMEDGRWRSPGTGRAYREDSKLVQGILAKRGAAGLDPHVTGGSIGI